MELKDSSILEKEYPEKMKIYLDFCKAAAENDHIFKSFKHDKSYTFMLEHCPPKIGMNWLAKINSMMPFLLTDYPKVFDNDKVGEPNMWQFTENLNCSPTTLQYLGVVLNLINRIGPLTGFSITEVGGGYGGQCKIIQDVFKIKSYVSIDMPEVIALQKKYLSTFDINNVTFLSNMSELKETESDLFISNYALSEVANPLQNEYVKKFALPARHGYITANGPIFLEVEIAEKYPETFMITPDEIGQRASNFIISW